MDRKAQLDNARLWVGLVLDHFNLSSVIPVRWNARMTRTRGVAKCYTDRTTGERKVAIELSPVLFAASPQDERDECCAHEAAHAAIWLLHGRIKRGRKTDHHGPIWQNAMRSLGFEPKRCHSVDRAGIGQQTHRVYCGICKQACGSCTTKMAKRVESAPPTAWYKTSCCGKQEASRIRLERVK